MDKIDPAYKVLSWRVFNTMDALQYANLLRETIEEYGNTARFYQSLDYNVLDEMYKCLQYNELERKQAA